jgi:hypothetical protein
MADTSADPNRHTHSYFHLFHSQTDRLHSPVKPWRAGQGRALGPMTYHPPEPKWLKNEAKLDSSFASKVEKTNDVQVLTSEIDYYAPPDSLHAFMHRSAPGERSLPWSQGEQRPVPKGDRPFDGFHNPDQGSKSTLRATVENSKRLFATSFKSESNRFRYGKESVVPAPGTYDVPNYSIAVSPPGIA